MEFLKEEGTDINLLESVFLVEMSWVRDGLVDRLHGVHIHVDPIASIENLSVEEASRATKGNKAIIEQLFHIVYWLDFSISLIQGEIKPHSIGSDWAVGDISWESLIERFMEGIKQLEVIAKEWDLDQEVSVGEGVQTTVGAELMGVAQHTSYHVGQIVSVRKALGLWVKD